MAADPQIGFLEALGALSAKWLPGAVGAAISLRFTPPDSGRAHMASTLLGGFACAIYAGPAIAAVIEVSSVRVEAGIVFACGLFGLAAIGQLWVALAELQPAVLLRDLLRKWFGIGGGS